MKGERRGIFFFFFFCGGGGGGGGLMCCESACLGPSRQQCVFY